MSFLQLLSLLFSNTEQRGLRERSWFEIRAFICRQLRKLFSSCQVAHKASSLCLPQPAFSAAVLCTLFSSFVLSLLRYRWLFSHVNTRSHVIGRLYDLQVSVDLKRVTVTVTLGLPEALRKSLSESKCDSDH